MPLLQRAPAAPLHLPPLRVRRGDIPETVHHLLGHVARRCGLRPSGISEGAMAALCSYDWPGNVRELRNVLERALVIAGGGEIAIEHLPVEIQDICEPAGGGPEGFVGRVEAFKRKLLLEALEASGWSKQEAAASLGLSPRAMSHHVSRFDLDRHRTPES